MKTKKLITTVGMMPIIIGAVLYLYFSMTGGLESERIGMSAKSPVTEDTEVEYIEVPELEFKDYTASFEIYTNGTKRIFTQPMYHEQSPAVYIQAADPSQIIVAEENITWNDFFSTLPFSVTEECLVTGTGQEFCTGEDGTLTFYLNDREVDAVLDSVIEPYQTLSIRFE